MFIASDVSALVRHTSSVVVLDDGELASVSASGFPTFSDEVADTAKSTTTVEVEDVELAGHRDFMHQEMFEQPMSVERMLTVDWARLVLESGDTDGSIPSADQDASAGAVSRLGGGRGRGVAAIATSA